MFRFREFYRKLPLIREIRHSINRIARLQDAVTALISIQAQQFLEWKKLTDPRFSEAKRLQRYAFQVCSQNGEDGIIQEIFRRIGTTDRVFFESGVGTGIENNTAFLLALGWNGFWVDSNPRFLKKLEKTGMLERNQLRYLVSKINKENICSLFSKLGVPQEFDLLSLDIDQNTYYAWEALGQYRPRLVVIEYNGALPAETHWVVQYSPERTWDGTINYGASLKALENLGRDLGYSLVGCEPLGANAFFVRDDFLGNHFAGPYTSENHFEPARFHLTHRMGPFPSAILDQLESC
jgi:hypothetical protein